MRLVAARPVDFIIPLAASGRVLREPSSVSLADSGSTPKLIHHSRWGTVDLLSNLAKRVAEFFEDLDTASFFKS
jgi:hypothetical protein